MALAFDLDELVGRARDGQHRAVARLISLVADTDTAANPRVADVARALTPFTGNARIVGLTGPPGVGKSTSTSALLTALRAAGKRVGVLAIDPSSPFSGGALLGDRIRMTEHATDPGVFIRSMATRGHLGGLSWATPQAVRVLDAAGFDVVLIETVGVGQSEVDVVKLADTTVVLLAPGMGDGIQAAKAGVLEIADVFVVNKADREGADATVHDLKQMISLARREVRGPSWRQPIVPTVASTGQGVDDVVHALDAHHEWLVTHGELPRRRAARAREEVEAIAVRRLRAELADLRHGDRLAGLADRVVARELDPFAAADELVEELRR
ncbi:methylmalonyl Co-A mutase-associated GTPase MeaB [Amycolatopsis sp. NPDC059027]|uniref:methylmalonyl Co-A mutase-associated GTPase MeaB n=1 Tax=unclassified Amycolatopsis TaxID=2618356 RepID=UPI00366EB25D